MILEAQWSQRALYILKMPHFCYLSKLFNSCLFYFRIFLGLVWNNLRKCISQKASSYTRNYQYAKSRCKQTGLFINVSKFFHQIYMVLFDSGSCTDSYILMDILKLLLSMHIHREKGKCDASN